MERKFAQKKAMASSATQNPKPLKPSSTFTNQAVLGFSCKKPIRLGRTISAKLPKTPTKSPTSSILFSKSPSKFSAKALSDDISTPEKVYNPPSSRSRNKRIAKSLNDVITEAKKLQMSKKKNAKKPVENVAALEAKTPKTVDFNLPEKYALLAESFDAMESAIRLLRLRKKISTFGNICPQVEAMTNRRFMYYHVAQMKYILPEVLLVEKMMIHDEKTLCMKAELKITLLHDALSNAKYGHGIASASKANTSTLRKTFHTRLVEFVKSHPKGDDVPLEDLPEPFNKKPLSTLVKIKNHVPTPSSTPSSIHIHKEADPPITMSPLLPKSFQIFFSHLSAIADVAPNSSCVLEQEQILNFPDVPEVRKPYGSGANIPSSASSHFPAGLKSHCASKFLPNEISWDNNGLKKSYEIDSSPVLKQPDASEATIVYDPLENPCKILEAKHISNNVAKENTLCKNEMVLENASSSLGKGCFSVTTERVELDSGILDTISVVPISHKTPLKSCIKSSTSKKTIRFEDVPDSPDEISHISSPQSSQSSASPNSSHFSQLFEEKPKASNVRRAIFFNKCEKNNIQSLKKGIIQPCKINFDIESNSSKETEIESISVQKSCYKGLENFSESEREILKILPPKLVSKVCEREKKNLEDCKLGLSAAKRRQQMIACLPKLFNMIRDIFRFSKCSVITQQELVHKIISNNCDVTDKSEVKEQLQLLQELVPDWISGKTATSGDYLYSIKTNADLRSIQTKLVNAV